MPTQEVDVLPGGIREAARRLGRSERVMYREARKGTLPFVFRVGSSWIVPREAFSRFLRGELKEAGE